MRNWLAIKRGKTTQHEVAKTAGIAQSSYAMIEGGKRNPSVTVAKRIANALGFEWTRFFEDEQTSA